MSNYSVALRRLLDRALPVVELAHDWVVGESIAVGTIDTYFRRRDEALALIRAIHVAEALPDPLSGMIICHNSMEIK